MASDDRRRAHGRPSPLAAAALVVVLAVALALRLWNLHFGLPDWYHPDEPLKAHEVSHIAAGDLDPGYFYHPSFMLYAAAATLRLQHEVIGTPLGEQEAVRAGRAVVALLGSGTVVLTYVLGDVVGGPFVALVAAALLAVAPLHVVCSHYLKEDVPLTFWTVAAVLASLRIVSTGRRRDYFLTGVLAGIGAGTKYVGLLLVGLPWLASRERPEHEGSGRWLSPGVHAGLIGSVIGFLLTTPYAVLDWWSFGQGVGHEGGNVVTGMAGIVVMPLPYLWTFHLRYSIAPGLGIAATALALIGFVRSLREQTSSARILTTVVFVLYTVLESSPYKPPPNFDRYVVPLLPLLCIFVAQVLQTLEQWLATRSVTVARFALVAALMITIGWPLMDSVQLDRAMAADTRDAAREWLVAHACHGERILLEGGLAVHGDIIPSYVARLPPGCDATYTYSLALRDADLSQYDLVVASSFMYDRYLNITGAPEGPEEFYQRFFASHQPTAEFAPAYRSYGFQNPTIRIYRNAKP